MRHYSKEILKYLLLTGMLCIAASSPYFILRSGRKIFKKDIPKKKFSNMFDYLKRRGLIDIRREGSDVEIKLTEEGKKRAGKYQIDDLEIEKSKEWDKKWRLVIFDVPNPSRLVRDVFRRKLKAFGFYPLQKSVWIYPYKCGEEINTLREFLGMSKKQIQVLEVAKIENDGHLKKFFNLSE